MSTDNVTLKPIVKAGFGQRKLSTIAKIKADDKSRAAFQATYVPLLPKGHAASPYQADWEDYTLMGAITPIAFIRREMGDHTLAQQQAYETGVRVRKGMSEDKRFSALTPGGKDCDKAALNAWLKADDKGRLEMLKAEKLI